MPEPPDLTPTPTVTPPKGVKTFRSLCASARLDKPMSNVVRANLGIKRNQLDLPCDEAKFKAALDSLGPEVLK